MSGMSDKISGKAKQVAGKITNDKKLQAEGKAEELRGKAKDTVQDMKQQIDTKIAEHKQRG